MIDLVLKKIRMYRSLETIRYKLGEQKFKVIDRLDDFPRWKLRISNYNLFEQDFIVALDYDKYRDSWQYREFGGAYGFFEKITLRQLKRDLKLED